MREVDPESRFILMAPPAPTMPPGLVELMEDLSRNVLRNNPEDVYGFCAEHMRRLLVVRDSEGTEEPKGAKPQESKVANVLAKAHKKAAERRALYECLIADASKTSNALITEDPNYDSCKEEKKKDIIDEPYVKEESADTSVEESNKDEESKGKLVIDKCEIDIDKITVDMTKESFDHEKANLQAYEAKVNISKALEIDEVSESDISNNVMKELDDQENIENKVIETEEENKSLVKNGLNKMEKLNLALSCKEHSPEKIEQVMKTVSDTIAAIETAAIETVCNLKSNNAEKEYMLGLDVDNTSRPDMAKLEKESLVHEDSVPLIESDKNPVNTSTFVSEKSKTKEKSEDSNENKLNKAIQDRNLDMSNDEHLKEIPKQFSDTNNGSQIASDYNTNSSNNTICRSLEVEMPPKQLRMLEAQQPRIESQNETQLEKRPTGTEAKFPKTTSEQKPIEIVSENGDLITDNENKTQMPQKQLLMLEAQQPLIDSQNKTQLEKQPTDTEAEFPKTTSEQKPIDSVSENGALIADNENKTLQEEMKSMPSLDQNELYTAKQLERQDSFKDSLLGNSNQLESIITNKNENNKSNDFNQDRISIKHNSSFHKDHIKMDDDLMVEGTHENNNEKLVQVSSDVNDMEISDDLPSITKDIIENGQADAQNIESALNDLQKAPPLEETSFQKDIQNDNNIETVKEEDSAPQIRTTGFVANIKTSNGEEENGNDIGLDLLLEESSDIKTLKLQSNGSIDTDEITYGSSMDKLENDTSVDDSDILNNPTMDLETAAVTIQKVFRSFLFKSRENSTTLDDEAPLDIPYLPDVMIDHTDNGGDCIVKPDGDVYRNPNKERRSLGLSRMDTVLQTVNEEKSLSLSDDSSTISSAATVIQAHVRGFLTRNKLAQTMSDSLTKSQTYSLLADENDSQNSKTVLNIHIIPESRHLLSRDESMALSLDLPMDSSPPKLQSYHSLGYDITERRKLLKREDAIQSISPPSNNSNKSEEIVNSTEKDREVNEDECITGEENSKADESKLNEMLSGDTTPTTADTVIEVAKEIENSTQTSVAQAKLSSDELDATNLSMSEEKETPLEQAVVFSRMLHSGEFHDVVIPAPTQVARSDTSHVARGE